MMEIMVYFSWIPLKYPKLYHFIHWLLGDAKFARSASIYIIYNLVRCSLPNNICVICVVCTGKNIEVYLVYYNIVYNFFKNYGNHKTSNNNDKILLYGFT